MSLNGTRSATEEGPATAGPGSPRRWGGLGSRLGGGLGGGRAIEPSEAGSTGSSVGGRVAAVHEAGGERRVVIIEALGAGRASTIVHSERTPIAGGIGTSGALVALLNRSRVDRVVRLAPAHECIARAERIPSGSVVEMSGALDLLLEARLPPEAPMHRRAAGVIGSAAGAVAGVGERSALLTAWMPGRGEALPPAPLGIASDDERWVTPAAALSALIAHGCERERGGGLALWAEREHGSITAIAYSEQVPGASAGLPAVSLRPVARVLLDEPADAGWASMVQRVAGESASSAGVTGPLWKSAQGTLWLSSEQAVALQAMLGSSAGDGQWMDHYGLALGAALAATWPDPLARPLANLRAQRVEAREAWLVRAARGLSKPGRVWWVGVGLLALGMLVPLGLASGRVWLAESRFGTATETQASLSQLERQALLYQQLEKSRWPMSKLLADVSQAAPEKVRVEQVRLATDQGLTLIGTASDAAELSLLQQRLTETRIFRGVRANRSEAGSDGRLAFELTAVVASPHTRVPKAEDFASRTLAQRLYNDENASNLEYKPEAGGGGVRTERARERGGERGGERGSRATEAQSASGSEAQPAGESSRRPSATSSDGAGAGPPKPLSDDDIAKMTREQILKEFPARRKYARNTAGIDPAEKDRLEQEVTKLQDRLKKLNAGGGS
jgi:hypothetical protein